MLRKQSLVTKGRITRSLYISWEAIQRNENRDIYAWGLETSLSPSCQKINTMVSILLARERQATAVILKIRFILREVLA